MPELPDVEVFRRHLEQRGLRRPIERVEILDGDVLQDVSRQGLGRALARRRMSRTHRHGKHLFARAGERWLALHFGMTGALQDVPRRTGLPDHTKVALHYAGGGAMAFVDQRKLGRVSLTHDPADFVHEHDLGPDALSLSRVDLRDLMSGRTGTVKSSLMNQSHIAGIGNIYSDEILYQARIHPSTTPTDLDDAAVGRLHRQLRRVLRMAADRGADPSRMPRTWLLPHRHPGEKCRRCGGEVTRYRAGGRGAYFCPRCQRSPE